MCRCLSLLHSLSVAVIASMSLHSSPCFVAKGTKQICSWPLSIMITSFFMSSNRGMFLTIRSCRETWVLRTILVGHLSFLLSKCHRRTTPKMSFGIINHLRRKGIDCLRDRIRLQEVQLTKSTQSNQLIPNQLTAGSVLLLTEQAAKRILLRTLTGMKMPRILLETFVQYVRCPFAFWWCRRPDGILLNVLTF